MINNIIKEEIEEEEENSSNYNKNTNENIDDNDNKNEINNINDKIYEVIESSKEEQSGVSLSDLKLNKEPENDLTELSEDLLPAIYSKYQVKFEPKKNKALITSKNLNLDEKDDEKRTILHRACLQIKLTIIKDLAPKLTNMYVNQLDKYGNSPLILACKYSTTNESRDRQEILDILIKNGANIHCIEPINGWTALHWCCYNGDLASVKLLINYGSNFFLPSKYGFFTIDLAGKKLFYELVSYLIKITTNFLQKIGEYELLDNDKLISDNINLSSNNNISEENEENTDNKKFTLNIGKISSFKNKNKIMITDNSYKRKSLSGDVKNIKKGIFTDLSIFPKINQTIYLRLFTEHCLYWACYFNYNEKIINMFLSLYNARPGFPLFSLDNRTSLHAACTQGSLVPFQLVYKTYEIKRKKKLKQDKKSDKKVPVSIINDDNNMVTCISYPKEFNQLKKKFLSSEHFNSFKKEFRKYIENNFFELIYPKTLIEKLPLDKIFDNDRNTPITLACKYNNQDFIKLLKDKNLVENIYDELKPENNLGFSGYYYLKNVGFRRKFLEEAGNSIYIIPPVILELNKNIKTISNINLIMKIAINEGLIVSLMQHIDDSKVYILVDIHENLFYEQAEKEKIEMKLLDKNLLLKFENNQKFIDSVEPFLSRQYQNIIIKCISNCLDIEMLKNQKILNQIFLTHIPNITTKIYNSIIKRPFYFLNPIYYFFDFFRENKNTTYSYIKLLHSYFGESISMYYAFYAYLTIMYSPLVFASIGYFIFYGIDLFSAQDIYPSFFIVFTFWNMFISIKWKRKCNEIQQKWGLKVSSDYQIIRTEFKGDEYYTDLDAPLEKHVSKYDSFIPFFAALPFILILLGANIVVFYFTTKWEDMEKQNPNFWYRYVPSIARSLGLVIIAKIYDIIANYSTYLENRKQEEVYELVMSIKIFIFRLISDFMAVIYSAIVTRDIIRLKTLLYTHICIKYLSEIGIRFLYPILWNYFFKKVYFKKVQKKTKEYPKSINNNINNIDEQLPTNKDNNNNINIENINKEIIKNDLRLKENNLETQRDFNRIKSEQVPLSAKKSLTTLKDIISSNEKYKRVSIISKSDTETNQNDLMSKIFNINPDFIEIQKIFNSKSPVYYDYADILINHTLISLFAIIIPFAPLLCFVFSTISQNARLYIDIFHLKRPIPLSCKNIKTWNKILELNIIIMTFTNLFLYYFYGTDNFFVGKKTADKIEIILFSGEKSFFWIICAEHLFIMISIVLRKLISEVPNWVKREKENLLGYYQIMSLDKQKKLDLEIALKIEQYKNNIKELEQEKKIQNDKINLYEKNFDLINKELLFKQKKIEEYNQVFDEIKNSQKNIDINKKSSFKSKKNIYDKPKIKKLLETNIEKYQNVTEEGDAEILFTESISLEKNEEKNIFLSSKKVKKNLNIKMDKSLEKAIKEILNEKNIIEYISEKEDNDIDIIEIYFNSTIKHVFDSLEKIIVHNKLEFYLKKNICGIVICSLCSKNKGTFTCEQCKDILCLNCKENHIKNNLWKEHKVTSLNLPLKKNTFGRNIIFGITDDTIPFIKGENYSFPVSTYQNLGHSNLEKIFDLLYKYYITYNGINMNNTLSIKEYIQFRLELFTKIESVPEKAFQNEIENIMQKYDFNWTEVYYINRICFKCFKYYGAKTTIDKVFEPLKKLQIGEFEERLKILINILDIYDNKLILKSEVEKFLAVSLYQNYVESLSAQDIIDSIFPLDAKFIEFSALYSCITYKKNILLVFEHLLQYKEDKDNNDNESQ